VKLELSSRKALAVEANSGFSKLARLKDSPEPQAAAASTSESSIRRAATPGFVTKSLHDVRQARVSLICGVLYRRSLSPRRPTPRKLQAPLKLLQRYSPGLRPRRATRRRWRSSGACGGEGEGEWNRERQRGYEQDAGRKSLLVISSGSAASRTPLDRDPTHGTCEHCLRQRSAPARIRFCVTNIIVRLIMLTIINIVRIYVNIFPLSKKNINISVKKILLILKYSLYRKKIY
jgi:hypothetical protein